jgi:hypothetical protein
VICSPAGEEFWLESSIKIEDILLYFEIFMGRVKAKEPAADLHPFSGEWLWSFPAH